MSFDDAKVLLFAYTAKHFPELFHRSRRFFDLHQELMPSETKNLPNDMNETVYRKKQGMEGRKEGRKGGKKSIQTWEGKSCITSPT